MFVLKKMLFPVCILASSVTALAEDDYRGRFNPDAQYVLSGQLRKDIGPLPPMPYKYLTAAEGYDESALTPVPEPGVHPRVLMSPQDIERIQKQVALGDKADRYFRIIWNDVQALAQKKDLLSMGLQALVTNDDALGREAAELLVKEAKFREPMIDIFNTHPDMEHTRDNWYYYARSSISRVGGKYYDDAYNEGGAELVAKLAKESVVFFSDGDRQSGVFFNSPLSNYDYLHRWLTEEERVLLRRVLSKLTSGRYTSGMELPGHMFINNHMSMGEDLLLLNLAIEGEEGWDPSLMKEYAIAVNNKISYDISLGGLLHEKCKGFIPERATMAIARRAKQKGSDALPLLAHDHIKLMAWGKIMDSVNVFERYGIGPAKVPELGEGLQEPRFWSMGLGSGPWMDQFFNWAFMLKHVYPADPAIDYYYKSRMFDNGLGRAGADPSEKLPTPRIRYTHRDLMLMTATDGLRDESGAVIDYDQSGLPEEVTSKTDAWVDMARGVAMSRSSWDKDAMMVHYECRSDVFSAGHETPEANDFNLYADGVEWSARRDWYMDCYFRNMVLIDGYAGVYSPVAGKLMEVADNDQATTFISDATDQYNWRKVEKLFQLWHGLFGNDLNHMKPFKEHAMVLDRDVELPFQGPIKQYQENYVGLDWGNWHGETRGPERFQRWNDVDHVFRTLHMTKGENPYVLVVDDVRKDDQMHQYDWCMKLSPDVTLYKADSSVRNRLLEKGMPEDRTTDLILCLNDTKETRYQRYGVKRERQPKKGDPLLLVRVLWRNSTGVYPQPAFEESWGPKRIMIPAMAVDPEFRVLLYPHHMGDPLPLTSWNSDQTKLTISVGGHTDEYNFSKTDRERSVFTMQRDGELIASTVAGPAAPLLDTAHGYTPDRNHDDALRNYIIGDEETIRLQAPPAGMLIRYTLDGSEPTEQSPLYENGIVVNSSCTLTARTFARYWPFDDTAEGDNASESFAMKIVQQPLAIAERPSDLESGLEIVAHEIRMTLFEGKNGIFTGKKNMMPSFEGEEPLLHCLVPKVKIPKVDPQAPTREMENAYYKFSGYYHAQEDGVYGFKLNSCGPITLRVAGRDLISVTGPYGHSQKDRFGQVALAKGHHKIEFTVCDPVFWKGDQERPYEISLATMAPSQTEYHSADEMLYVNNSKGLALETPDAIPVSKPVKLGATEPGLVMKSYDRSAQARAIPPTRLPLEHFDIATEDQPYAVTPVLGLEPSDTAARLLDFSGYFIADVDGVYEFQTDRKGGNQLLFGGQDILHNSVIAPKLLGKISLTKGAHAFSFRIAESAATCLVKIPGRSTFIPVNTGMFVRPAEEAASSDGRLVAFIDGEQLEGMKLGVQGEGVAAEARNVSQVEGKTGQGLKMSGNESGLFIENLPSPENQCSIAFWMRVDEKTEAHIMESSWDSHPSARLRGYNLQMMYFRGSAEFSFDTRKVGADKGEWFHVVLTYDDKAAMYVNGELRGWEPKTENARNAHLKDVSLFKGLKGTVDDLRIYNKALSSSDVEMLFKKN